MHPSPADATNLAIEVEDAGHTNVFRGVLTTLSGQHGTQLSRFVARTTDTSDPPRGRRNLLDLPRLAAGADGGTGRRTRRGWPDEARAALEELGTALVAKGWQRTATGSRWWNRSYTHEAG